MAKRAMKTLKVKVPSNTEIVRAKRVRYRVWLFDFRGIRNHPPVTSEEFDVIYGEKIINYKGEKPTFSSPEALSKDVEAYFDSCYSPVVTKNKELLRDDDGNIVKFLKKPFTVAGLARYIGVPTSVFNKLVSGIADDWGETDEEKLYSAVLLKAKQVIEEYAETRLYDRDGVNGAKFVLDHHFKMVTRRDEAEIKEKERLLEIREQELDLKKQALNLGDETDNEFKITIVRKEKDDE